jgi:hypothetical protein
MKDISWGDVPTWGLFALALATAIFAGLAFRKQSKEVELLGQQLKDQQAINEKSATVADLQAQELRESLEQRKADAATQRRAQASKVFIVEQTDRYMVGKPGKDTLGVTARVMNESDDPIYKVLLSWHLGTAPQGRDPIDGAMMPGAESSAMQYVPDGANPDQFGAVVFFYDATGVCWRRRPDGQLDEILPGQEPPHSW